MRLWHDFRDSFGFYRARFRDHDRRGGHIRHYYALFSDGSPVQPDGCFVVIRGFERTLLRCVNRKMQMSVPVCMLMVGVVRMNVSQGCLG